MEKTPFEKLTLRLSELDAELVKVQAMANRADELADECETEAGEAVLRSEADSLWACLNVIQRHIEETHRKLAKISAAQVQA